MPVRLEVAQGFNGLNKGWTVSGDGVCDLGFVRRGANANELAHSLTRLHSRFWSGVGVARYGRKLRGFTRPNVSLRNSKCKWVPLQLPLHPIPAITLPWEAA